LPSSVRLEITGARVELVDANALLVPVDGKLCRLGGAAASALRLALADDERVDEMEYVEDALAQLRPLPHPEARVIDGVARWKHLVVSAAYPHDVDGATFSPTDCARMLRAALPSACAAAAEAGIEVLAATLVGTAYRMPADLAVRAFVDGIASANAAITVRWSLPDDAHRQLASAACQRIQS
jgi:hypothetical protein